MIYNTVKYWAKKRGYTISKLEKKAGLANGVIGRWRSYYPRLDNLMRVSDALEVSLEDLMKEDPPED